jgi:VCBS repeat-containing protein
VAYPDAVRLAEGESTGNLVAALLVNDTDVDVGDSHTITAVDAVGTLGAVLFDAPTQSLDYSAAGTAFNALAAGTSAADAFSYTVADTAGATSTASVNVTVDGVNDAPVLVSDIADQAALEDNPFSFQIPIDSFSDVDAGDVLTYRARLSDGSALPAWLSFDATTLTFSGTPVYANAGTIALGVTATDIAGASASALFDLSVNLYPDLVLIGSAGNDTLIGHSGNDTLDGGAGADTMIGAHGDDTYVVDKTGDVIVEHANQGADTVQTAHSYELGANLENLTITGKNKKVKATGNAADNVLTGNDKNNTLTGLAGNDWLDGAGGHDKMYGGLGDDTYVVDDKKDKTTEKTNEGIDTVRSSVDWTLDKNLENLVLVGTKAIDGKGNELDNLLVGNSAGNKLSGESGTDILQGLGGKDKLKNKSGAALIDGGAGEDKLEGGKGNELFIGGPGDDSISTDKGADIIAFNRGDGRDSVKAKGGPDDTLSLGGGIEYADLSLSRQGKDLVLNAGAGDSISFDNWFSKSGSSVVTLQVVAEAIAEFHASSSDPLPKPKVQTFDFAAIASAFDAAGQVNQWSLSNALLDFHLDGSDSEAMGGDLAYQYGATGTLAGIGATAAQDVLNAPQFGTGTQTLRPLDELQQGPNRLS